MQLHLHNFQLSSNQNWAIVEISKNSVWRIMWLTYWLRNSNELESEVHFYAFQKLQLLFELCSFQKRFRKESGNQANFGNFCPKKYAKSQWQVQPFKVVFLQILYNLIKLWNETWLQYLELAIRPPYRAGQFASSCGGLFIRAFGPTADHTSYDLTSHEYPCPPSDPCPSSSTSTILFLSSWTSS